MEYGDVEFSNIEGQGLGIIDFIIFVIPLFKTAYRTGPRFIILSLSEFSIVVKVIINCYFFVVHCSQLRRYK